MPFDDMSGQTHEFPAGPTNNFDPYYPDEYADDELDWDEDDERAYDFDDYGDDEYDYDDYYDPTFRERIGWRLSSLWYKVRHPIYELHVIRRRLRWRFATRCQVDGCGKRGTVDGMLCGEHFIPF